MAKHLLLPVLLNRKKNSFQFRNNSEGGVNDNVECVTCHVEYVNASSCTAMYAGISSGMAYMQCKVQSLCLRIKRVLA